MRGHPVRAGLATILAVGLTASACASGGGGSAPTSSVAVYPAKNQSPEQQARDVRECQAWAQQQTGYDPTVETAKGAGVGLLLGAAAGAATGAAIGAASGGGAGRGAAVGAVVGGVGGGVGGGAYQYSRTKDGYDRAYAACMQGRGYSVVR
jgi:hypothetical protein